MTDAPFQFGVSVTTLMILVAATGFVVSWMAARQAVQDERLGQRVRRTRVMINGFAEPIPADQIFFENTWSLKRPRRDWRARTERLMKAMPLARRKDVEALRIKLMQANWRRNNAIQLLFFAKFGLAFAFGGAAVTLVLAAGWLGGGILPAIMLGGGGAFTGLVLPELVLTFAVLSRKRRLEREMPVVLDLMVLCAEAGLPLGAVMERVSVDAVKAAPEITNELKICVNELKVSSDREAVFRNLYVRTGVDSFRYLALIMIQGDRVGTSLATSIRAIASEKRKERLLKVEAKAARLPVLMTMPMLLFFMPPIFLLILAPIFADFL